MKDAIWLNIVSKFYLVYLITWLLIFTLYVYYISTTTKKNKKENKMYFYISIALGSFCIIELLIMIIILATRSNKNVKKIEETLEKTIKMNSIKEEPISKKELKRQRKEQLKQEKLKLKEDKKKSKQKDNENMDSL